jgi:hypothetical protein
MLETLYRLRRIAAAGVVAFALSACSGGSVGGGSSYGTGDPNLTAPNVAGGPINPFLADGQAVLKALDTIEAHSGKPLRVTSMQADTTNGMMVNVQEPKNHVNVDEYKIAPDGTLTGPTPVRMMSMDGGAITAAAVDRQAFDPRAIAWARLSQTVKEAIAKSNYSDARAANWEFDGLTPDDKRYIYLESARARPVAEVKPDLSIVSVRF